MNRSPPFTATVAGLAHSRPFIGPSELERNRQAPLRLRLGANESSFGISPRAREAIVQSLDRLPWYGDPESYELREELARVHHVERDNLVVGSGIDDLLCLAARAFVATGTSIVTSRGTYPTFEYFVNGCGGVVHRVAYREDRTDLDALAETARRIEARLVYLANPDNPTGTWHQREHIEQLVQRLPASCQLLLDEAYADFAPAKALPPVDIDDHRVVRLRTFSKAHGLAGARIGYAIAATEVISGFSKIRVQFGVNGVAQAAALASLRDPAFLRKVAAAVADGRADYERLAARLGLNTLPSATNFVAIDFGTAECAQNLVATLLERGVFVRALSGPPLDRFVRVTVGNPHERQGFGEVFSELVEQLQPAVCMAVTDVVFKPNCC